MELLRIKSTTVQRSNLLDRFNIRSGPAEKKTINDLKEIRMETIQNKTQIERKTTENKN